MTTLDPLLQSFQLKHLTLRNRIISTSLNDHTPFATLKNKDGFNLARIGDAVAGRNIHAALYDALRVCKDL